MMAATVAAAATAASSAHDSELSVRRLYVLRAAYALIAFAQLAMTGPGLFVHEPTARGVISSMLVGMCLVDLLGIKYPRQMLPMLLFEFTWKYVWFFAFGLPQWLSGHQPSTFAEDFPAILFGVLLMPLVIPWGFVWRHYVKAAGQPWQ
jgi:hypothetical protein